jgi:hypothetical protein
MRSAILSSFLMIAVLLPTHSLARCIPFADAGKHIGETKCITGKVLRVEQGADGVHYLDFCKEPRGCAFTAVIFPGDLRHIGDVRKLEGKSVELHGELKEYDGGAQIVVSEARQIRGEEVRMPPLPKNYDVEQRGHYSAGIFRHPKTSYTPSKKRQPATLPVDIPDDSQE